MASESPACVTTTRLNTSNQTALKTCSKLLQTLSSPSFDSRLSDHFLSSFGPQVHAAEVPRTVHDKLDQLTALLLAQPAGASMRSQSSGAAAGSNPGPSAAPHPATGSVPAARQTAPAQLSCVQVSLEQHQQQLLSEKALTNPKPDRRSPPWNIRATTMTQVTYVYYLKGSRRTVVSS